MARTTRALIEGIVEVDSSVDLKPFIDAANELVTEICAPVTTYSATRLQMIETWLAAHFFKVNDGETEFEKAGPVSEKRSTKIDLHLNLTRYGQQAMLLDTAGGLAELNSGVQVGNAGRTTSVAWVGNDEEND